MLGESACPAPQQLRGEALVAECRFGGLCFARFEAACDVVSAGFSNLLAIDVYRAEPTLTIPTYWEIPKTQHQHVFRHAQALLKGSKLRTGGE